MQQLSEIPKLKARPSKDVMGTNHARYSWASISHFEDAFQLRVEVYLARSE